MKKMKKTITLLMLMCINVALFGQNDNSRSDDVYFGANGLEAAAKERIALKRWLKAEANKKPIYAAGTSVKESVNWQCAAVGSATIGGLALVVGTTSAENPGEQNNTMQIIGYAFIGFAVVSEVVSVMKMYDAGRSLQIGAGKIKYTF